MWLKKDRNFLPVHEISLVFVVVLRFLLLLYTNVMIMARKLASLSQPSQSQPNNITLYYYIGGKFLSCLNLEVHDIFTPNRHRFFSCTLCISRLYGWMWRFCTQTKRFSWNFLLPPEYFWIWYGGVASKIKATKFSRESKSTTLYVRRAAYNGSPSCKCAQTFVYYCRTKGKYLSANEKSP